VIISANSKNQSRLILRLNSKRGISIDDRDKVERQFSVLSAYGYAMVYSLTVISWPSRPNGAMHAFILAFLSEGKLQSPGVALLEPPSPLYKWAWRSENTKAYEGPSEASHGEGGSLGG
jgi:hypothetical protein